MESNKTGPEAWNRLTEGRWEEGDWIKEGERISQRTNIPIIFNCIQHE